MVNKVIFTNGKIIVNGTEINNVEKIKITSTAESESEVEVTFKAKIKDLDVDLLNL